MQAAKIKQFAKSIKEAREKATPGEWVVQQKSLSNFDHPYVFDRTYGAIFNPIASSTKLINRPNCDFVCIAANNITQLCDMVIEMSEALEFYENTNRLMISVRDIPNENEKFGLKNFIKSIDMMDNGDRARETLLKLAEGLE